MKGHESEMCSWVHKLALIIMSLCEIGYHLLLDVIIQNNNKSEFSPGFTATIKKQLFQHIQQQPPDKARSFRDM